MDNENEEIIKNAKTVINKARKIEAMLKSGGWKCFLEIKEKKKQELVDKMFKSEMTVKKHEYNRGAINFMEEIEQELQGCVDEAINSVEMLEEIDD